MTTEMMLEIVDEFFNSEADGNTSMLKYSLIAEYAVCKGHSVAGYDLRRNDEVRAKVKDLKNTDAIFSDSKPMVYKNLNVSEFVSSNRNIEKLKKSLTELDTYWHNIFEYASKIIVKNKELLRNEKQHNKRIDDLTVQSKALANKNKELSVENRKLVFENRYLKRMLKENLYPAIASEILRDDELHIIDKPTVPEQTIKKMADANYPKSFAESIKNDQKMLSQEDKILKAMWEECDV